MHQNNIAVPRLLHHFGRNTVCIVGTPVQRIDIPQNREHIQFFLKAFVPTAVRRPDKAYFLPCDFFENFIGLHQLLPKGLPVAGSELYVTIGMVPDQMSFVLFSPDNVRVILRILSRHEKVATTPRSFNPSRSCSVYFGCGPSSKVSAIFSVLLMSRTRRCLFLYKFHMTSALRIVPFPLTDTRFPEACQRSEFPPVLFHFKPSVSRFHRKYMHSQK